LAERAVALDARRALRLTVEQDGAGALSVAVYRVVPLTRPGPPMLRMPAAALRELARACSLLAGEVGERT